MTFKKEFPSLKGTKFFIESIEFPNDGRRLITLKSKDKAFILKRYKELNIQKENMFFVILYEMGNIQKYCLDKRKIDGFGKSPLQNPEILKKVQQLYHINKNITEMYRSIRMLPKRRKIKKTRIQKISKRAKKPKEVMKNG